MAEEQKKEGEGGDKKAASPGKFKAILQLVFAVVNIGVMLGGATLVFSSTVGYHDPALVEEDMMKELKAERAKREDGVVLYKLEKFTVNLDGLPARLIQIEMSLEMLDEQGFEEVVSKSAQARDAIVRVLNSKRAHELEGIQGKLYLKDQIMNGVNAVLKNGVVKNVYYSHFVVQ